MVVDSIIEQLGFDGAAPAIGHLAMPETSPRGHPRLADAGTAKPGGAETILQYYPVIFSGGLVATISTYMSSLFTVTANPMQIAIGGLATMGATFTARRTAVNDRRIARKPSDRQDRTVPGSFDDRQASVATGSRQPRRNRGRDRRPARQPTGDVDTGVRRRNAMFPKTRLHAERPRSDRRSVSPTSTNCGSRLEQLGQIPNRFWNRRWPSDSPNTLTKSVAQAEEAR